jgi:hypothetical protein
MLGGLLQWTGLRKNCVESESEECLQERLRRGKVFLFLCLGCLLAVAVLGICGDSPRSYS